MALLREITDEKGVKTNYHAITNLSHSGDALNIQVSSYVDESYRNYEKSAKADEDKITVVNVNSYAMENPKAFSYEEAYNYLKTLPDFKGAKDII